MSEGSRLRGYLHTTRPWSPLTGIYGELLYILSKIKNKETPTCHKRVNLLKIPFTLIYVVDQDDSTSIWSNFCRVLKLLLTIIL